ncbi:ABC transporter permease [Kitasatospora herbaricolor]|uniref:ABC transporter permease n=1 Tax=Kitasatospora herbaricolor TaxID=68217 RepID=UPI0019C341E4|nr:ABC transporter permease [Kitasatospora herbaricolor]MDQ0305712.1 ABC-2 type transport system permease protein [Kitasatospora herbaricolor]GGV27273.1 ABC transporter permease [Kitasatospora herbaricolor]
MNGPLSRAAEPRPSTRAVVPPSATRAPRPALGRALHAEWTKLRTAGGTWPALLVLVVASVGLSAAAAAGVSCPDAGCGEDATRLALTGVTLGQAVVVLLAAAAVGGEYGTGMIRTTLAALPDRGTAYAAKAAALAGAVLLAATAAVLGSLLAGRLILPGSGFTPAHGYPPLSLADGPTLRAAVGSVLYLALVALLTLGVATAVREPAAAAGVVLGLLHLFPLLIRVVADPDWQRHLQQLAPMTAGLAVQATTGLDRLPVAPWTGLAVLAGWSAGALLLGTALLRGRDA